MELEVKRNIVHLIFGTLVAVFILFSGKNVIWAFATLVLFTIMMSELCKHHHVFLFSFLLKQMERTGAQPGAGVLYFFLGTFTALLLFPPQTVFISVAILSFLDSFSTMAGITLKGPKLYGKKTNF